MIQIEVQVHKAGPPSYWLVSLSFHVNWPSCCRDAAITKFDLEIPRSRWWKRSKIKVTQVIILSICILFNSNLTIHFWNTAILIFQHENPKINCQSHRGGQSSRPHRGSNILSTHPFHSMLIGHPIPEIKLFQFFSMKIKGQGHDWYQISRSQKSSILLIDIPFIPYQSIPKIQLFQNLTLTI